MRSGLSSVVIFAEADAAQATGRTEDALALYKALARDPDLEVRTEARFRASMLLVALGRDREAALSLRSLLDEKPRASRARLELAAILARMGDDLAARRALREAQLAGLPPDVALVVDQFANALRSAKQLGGSLEVALAPDSNINRSTSARTLDTIIAPLTLSAEARRQSGLGIHIAGQGFARLRVTDRLTILPRLSIGGNVYRVHAFDDISGSLLAGIERRGGRDRLTVSVGSTWRGYGERLYARTNTATADWLHPVGRRAQLTISGSAARASYRSNALQDGGLFDLTGTGEYALSPRTGVGATLGISRQTARDPGYSTVAANGSLFGWREAGQTTLFASAGVRRTEGDARLFLFLNRRREWLIQLSGGATMRALKFRGFAPFIRAGYERNTSSVGLYDYARVFTNFGITRAF